MKISTNDPGAEMVAAPTSPFVLTQLELALHGGKIFDVFFNGFQQGYRRN